MTTTNELIGQLAADAKAIPRPGAVLRRLSIGLAIGVVAASVATVTSFGMPLQAVHHTGAAAFAMKLLFSTALFGIALVLLFVAGRPGHELGQRWLWLLMPPAVVAISEVTAMSMAPRPPQIGRAHGSTSVTKAIPGCRI